MRLYTFLFFLFFYTAAYTQDTATILTYKQRLKETEILRSAFSQLHPGLYRYNSKKEITRYFDDLSNNLSLTTDAKKYFVLLSQMATRIKCGHTYLNPWNQEATTKDVIFSKTFFPLLYKMAERKMIVTYNLSGDKTIRAGDRIMSINGIPVNAIIDSLLTVSRADGNNGLSKKLNNVNLLATDIDSNSYSLFDIYFPLFFPSNFNTQYYTVVVRSLKGKDNVVTIDALSKKERQNVFVSGFGAISVGEQNWQFRFINPSTAYFKIGDFVTWSWKKDYKQYLDSIFSTLKKEGTANLILDVRGNEGGDDDTRNELLSYLVRKSFGCYNPEQRLYKSLSVPDSLLPYLQTWNEEFKKPKDSADYTKTPNGFYLRKNVNCISIYPKADVFTGNLYVLIDAKNSSTTFTMADLLQTTHSATLIGESTGGTKQGLNGGQFFFLHLPYSNFEIDLPLIWQAPERARSDEGVLPDYQVLTTPEDIHKNNDRQLEKAMSLIKQ